MARLSFSSRAREDLLEIWRYIAERSPRAADRMFDLIEARCQGLREHPQLGPARPDIGEGARALAVERWLILYRQIEGGVQVVRVVDGARDLGAIDWIETR